MYVPGYPPHSFPLARYLPPVAEGVAAGYAEEFTAPGDIVVDPFGQSPRVALELARLGRKVIAATRNPVLRLSLGAAIDPVPTASLRSALTRLADARLAGERVEAYLRGLYRSTCPDCGSAVEVDTFLWEREVLVEKSYHCEICGAERTRPVTAADLELAARIPPRGPQYHWALEHIVPGDDPDRQLFGEALEAYTPRSLNVLFTLTLKNAGLELNPLERRALDTLLLMAYDEGLSLGPSGTRPRTLKPHVRFSERNIWLALERLARDGSWQSDDGEAVPLLPLDRLPSASGVVIHEGSVQGLVQSLEPQSVACLMSALPRPNLVLWTLSTAWAAWLWGSAAATPLRQLIRRRRYDWAWHENALRSSFSAARPLLSPTGRLVALLPEAEAGFVAAALTAADGGGYSLIQHALRNDPAEAQFVFQTDSATPAAPDDLASLIQSRSAVAAVQVLQERGEPSRWNTLSGAIYVSLARDHSLRLAVDEMINDPLNYVDDLVEAACLNSSQLVDLRSAEGVVETARAANGIWWLVDSAGAATALADRAEHEVARALAATLRTGADNAAVERRVCDGLPGLTLPGGALIRRCLESYGEEREDLWFFRPEDNPLERANDFDRIQQELAALGQRLGYSVESGAPGKIVWRANRPGLAPLHFFVTETAEIGRFILEPGATDWSNQGGIRVIVIPGGRAGLINYKVKRDPRLRVAIEQGGWLFVKYRHIRRLLSEPALELVDSLTILNRDPITEEQPAQLPLW